MSKLLNTPANMTVETLGELLFAIDGSSPVFGCKKMLREPKRNNCEPDWLATGHLSTGNKKFSFGVPTSKHSPSKYLVKS